MAQAREPLWTLDELGARVALALATDYPGQASGRVRDLPDRRTIRYYTTLGLIDRPAALRGRTALYGTRHLLQLAAIKRLQANGLTLAEIQTRLVGLTDGALRTLARLPADFDQPPPPSENSRGDPRRDGSFWSATPAEPAPPAAPVAPPTLVGVPLAPGATLLLESARPPDDHDLAALRVAAAPLLKLLHARRLLADAGASSPKGDSP